MHPAALLETARRWLAAGRAGVLVQVREARGSVPRDAGARMLVGPDVAIGSIGGGHLELQAIAAARELLPSSDGVRELRFVLGPSLGQCCGGAVMLSLARLEASQLLSWPLAPPRFHLQLHGAGHVGRAIARLLVPMNVRVDWLDERASEFPASLGDGPWPAHIRTCSGEAIEGEVARAPAGAFYLVLTHRHDLDQRIVEAVLRRGDVGFLGLIGSATKRQRFLHRLHERGVPAAALARMTCPIGLPGIGGKEPEVIAVSVVAQLLQVAGPGRSP